MYGNFMKNNIAGMSQYVVKQGDSLYKIAKAHNVTVDELKKVNHLYSNTIYPNQILFIPNNNSIDNSCNNITNNTYLTASGESLKDILIKFNINLNDLQNYNDIDNLKLEGNQMLLIEKRNNYNFHKVEAGETVEDILAKYQLSPLELLKLNENIFLKPNENIIVKK